MNSIESETDVKRLLFLGRLITQPKMSVAVRTLFQSRTESFLDMNIVSIGVVSCICEALQNMTFLTISKRSSTTVYSLRTQSGKNCEAKSR